MRHGRIKYWMLLPVFLYAQLTLAQSKDPMDILSLASEACKKLQSIEYTTTYTMGAMTVQAKVHTEKASVVDVGFGSAKIIVDGELKVPNGEQAFKYSYDGTNFKFHEPGKGDIKTIQNPDVKSVSRTLGFQYFMPVMNFYTTENGMEGMIERIEKSELIGMETINGEDTYHLRVYQSIVNPATKESTSSSSDWHFSQSTYLPIRFSSKSTSREVRIVDFATQKETRFDINVTNDVSEKLITGREPKTEGLLSVGSEFPGFTLNDIEGNSKQLADFEAKVVLVDFWGTWCGPCLLAMPDLEKLHQKYKDKGLSVIGISVHDAPGKAEKYVASKAYSYNFLVQGDKLARSLKLNTYPTIFILDDQGKVLHAEKGKREGAIPEFEKIIEAQLKRKEP